MVTVSVWSALVISTAIVVVTLFNCRNDLPSAWVVTQTWFFMFVFWFAVCVIWTTALGL